MCLPLFEQSKMTLRLQKIDILNTSDNSGVLPSLFDNGTKKLEIRQAVTEEKILKDSP